MSWLSSWLRRDSTKLVLSLVQKLIRVIVGKVADDLEKIALEEVKKAEASGLSGIEKYKMALSGIKGRPQYRDLPQYVLNIAIESAVAVVDWKSNIKK